MNRLTRFGALSAFLSLVLWGGKDVAAATKFCPHCGKKTE